MNWDDLKVFLDVARQGGLNPAARVTGLSPATLGRRMTALEQRVGEPLFVRSQSGYRLTAAGQALQERAADLEGNIDDLQRWLDERNGNRVIRISAGPWTANFLARNIGKIWLARDGFQIALTAANEKIDIGHRRADIGIRNARPTEQWLAGKQMGRIAFARYAARNPMDGLGPDMFVGLIGPAQIPSARWLEAHHGDHVGLRGSDAVSVLELVAAGAGIGVLPCFIGDADSRLVRVAGVIDELGSEQWLVTHHDDRHTAQIRTIGGRITRLMRQHRRLFEGQVEGWSAPGQAAPSP